MPEATPTTVLVLPPELHQAYAHTQSVHVEYQLSKQLHAEALERANRFLTGKVDKANVLADAKKHLHDLIDNTFAE